MVINVTHHGVRTEYVYMYVCICVCVCIEVN